MALHPQENAPRCHLPTTECAVIDAPLQAERIESTHRLMPPSLRGSDLDKTLLCFVLVDPHGKHAFCSRYDFGPWPLLAGVSTLPGHVTQVKQQQGYSEVSTFHTFKPWLGGGPIL